MNDVARSEVHGRRPWEGLPAEAIDALAPVLPSVTEEIIETLRREVPAYAKPLEGEFGRTVRLGVEQALEQFAALVGNPGAQRTTGRTVYVELGRGELRAGRSIGALLAAYRVGARVAWRRLSAVGLEAGLSQATLNRLAESIFAYIDELSAESAEGFALEQARQAGESERMRSELVEQIVRERRSPGGAELGAAAEAAGWRLPATIVVVVWWPDPALRPQEQLPSGAIVAERNGIVCAVVPDPDGPGRGRAIRDALVALPCGVGTATAPARGSESFRHAAAALALGEERGVAGPVFAADHRAALISRADRSLVDTAAEQRLGALDGETPGSRQRLRETLLAWLRHDGNVAQAAAELHVHSQTVRYRLARLRDLLGDELDDPDARFEMEVALRASV